MSTPVDDFIADDFIPDDGNDFSNVQAGHGFGQKPATTGIVAAARRALSNFNPINIVKGVIADSPFLSGPMTEKNADERVGQFQAGLSDTLNHPVAAVANQTPVAGPAMSSFVKRFPEDPSGAITEGALNVGIPAAAGFGISKAIPAVEAALPESGQLMDLASRARRFVQNNPVSKGIEDINIYKPLTLVRGAARVLANPVARGVARGADNLAGLQLAKEMAASKAAAEGAYTQPIPNAPNTVPTPRQSAPAQLPPQDFFTSGEVTPEPPAYTQPIPNAPNTVRTPVAQDPVVNAAKNLLEGLPEQDPFMFEEPNLVPPEVEGLQRAINPAGAKAQTWVVQNAEKVFDVAPELKNLQPGPEFQVKAINAYNRADQTMHAAERSVPPGTQVDTMPIKEELDGFIQDLASQGRVRDVAAVEKLVNSLDAGLMPWEDFLKVKQGIMKLPGASSSAMRRAYSAFIKAAGRVSPELMKASNDYATMRRVLEYSRIDPLTRRPLKPPKR